MPDTDDLYCFSHEHLFAQITGMPMVRGHFAVKFYAQDGMLSREPTATVAEFFFYPSAGTIRDGEMNIVYYSSLIDKYNKRYAAGGAEA